MSKTEGRISLWAIEVFAATAAEGSISATARRLETSVATISQQLTNLEGALGVTLLDRGKRPISLTPKGAMFLRRAHAILNEAEQARAELALADLSRLRRLRLGMIEDFDADVTPALLSRMSEDLKNCQFLLETGASHRLVELLDQRALDIVVTADMSLPSDGLEIHALLKEPFIAVIPKGWSDKDELQKRLRRLPFVQYTSRHHMGRAISAHLSRENVVLDHRFELDSYHAILSMVAKGDVWSIITPLGWHRAHRFHDNVDVVPLPFAAFSRRIHLSARRGVLGDMPEAISTHLRGLLMSHVVAPITSKYAWLADDLRVL